MLMLLNQEPSGSPMCGGTLGKGFEIEVADCIETFCVKFEGDGILSRNPRNQECLGNQSLYGSIYDALPSMFVSKNCQLFVTGLTSQVSVLG